MIDEIVPCLPLQQLERKSNGYHCRCPICQDSQKSKYKKRGWIYFKNKKFVCYNCNVSMSFYKFLKTQFPDMFKMFFRKNRNLKNETKDLIKTNEIIKERIELYNKFPAKSLEILNESHEAIQYVKERKIPENKWNLLYYTDDFTKFTNKMTNDKYKDWRFTESRLLIPFRKKNGDIFAYQGRSFQEDAKIRYMTIKLDEDYPKIFGLQTVDYSKPIIAVEGPIDSMFIENCVAFAGSDLSIQNILKFFPKQSVIIAYDFEDRNKEINDKIQKFLKHGFKVSLMPKQFLKYGKDINQMVENGLTKEFINDMILKNVIQGQKGILQHKIWRIR